MIRLLCLLALQDDLTVLRPDENPKTLLYEALRAECKAHFDVRRAAVAALKTPDDVQRRRQVLRTRFLEALGGLPERTPLNARVVGELKGDGFRVEKVIYESRPGHHVTAALYLPEGKGPFPGVLVPCGHSDNGKAAEAYQRASILMAKSGLAALCYDPISQGERWQTVDAAGKPVGKGNVTEHTMIGLGALLVGECAATYRIWDGLRSLDYLEGRPEVDPKRLACAGNSGGGTLTSYLMALDDRIAVAAPSCYITTLERLFETIGPQDAEQNIPGQVAFGMEHADYLLMRAPRPTLINVGTRDYFDIEGAKTTFREARGVYKLLGREEAVELFEFDDKHGWSQPRRESAARWMRRWLLDDPRPVAEPAFPVFKDAELRCTPSGQVLADLRGRSVFDLLREKGAAPRPEKSLREISPGLLALRPSTSTVVSRNSVTREGVEIHRRVVKIDGLTMPELEYRPPGKKGGAVLIVHGGGKAKAHGEALALAKAGTRVVAPDLPGWGETAQHPGGKPFGPDWKEAALSLHLARPLLGRRVGILLEAVDRVGAEKLVGIGAAGPAALHAAVLSGTPVELVLEDAPVSWASVLANPQTDDQYSNALPGVLKAYDLPDLAAARAPAKLTIRRPVDAAGRPVPQEQLESTYARAREAYAAAGAPGNLVLEGAR
jgi:dienelactone hydrolase